MFASGEPGLDELILVTGQALVLDWVLEALTKPGGYCNPVDVSLPSVTDLPVDENSDDEDEDPKELTAEQKKKLSEAWSWDQVPDENKPDLTMGEGRVTPAETDADDYNEGKSGFPSVAVPETEFRF